MQRTYVAGLMSLAILLLPVAAQAQQAQGGGQSGNAKQSSARSAALKECQATYGRTGRGAADNTAILIEQCMKNKLGGK